MKTVQKTEFSQMTAAELLLTMDVIEVRSQQTVIGYWYPIGAHERAVEQRAPPRAGEVER